MDFHKAFSPLIYLSAILGVSTLSYIRINGSKAFAVSTTCVKYVSFSLIANLIVICIMYMNMPANYDEGNLFSIAGQIIGVGDFVLFVITHYTSLIHRKKIVNIWSQLHFSSRKLLGKQHLGYPRTFILIILQSVFHFLLILTSRLSNDWDTLFLCLFYLSFGWINYMNYIAELSFTSVLFALSGLIEKLTSKFHKLACIAEKNNFFEPHDTSMPIQNPSRISAIKHIVSSDVEDPLTMASSYPNTIDIVNSHSSKLQVKEVDVGDIIWSPSYFVKEINRLAEFQSSLYELSQEIDRVFGTQILFSVAQTFISTTFVLFVCFLKQLELKAAAQFTAPIHMLFLWGVSIATRLLVLVYSCNSALTQADVLATQLSGLLVKVKQPQIKEEIQMFSLQLLHNKVRFTACGFFPLDATLLYGVVGGVTTYLVILIQFQLASEHKT